MPTPIPMEKLEAIAIHYRDTPSATLNSTAAKFRCCSMMVSKACSLFGVERRIHPHRAGCEPGQARVPYGPKEHAAWMAEHVRMHDFEPLGGSSLAQEPSRL